MKKAVSMLLSVVLSLSLFAGFGQTAFAAEEESTAGAGLQEYLEELMSREQNEDGSYALDEDIVYAIDDGEAYAQGMCIRLAETYGKLLKIIFKRINCKNI